MQSRARSWTKFSQSAEVKAAAKKAGVSTSDALALLRDGLSESGTTLAAFGMRTQREQLDALDDILRKREESQLYQATIAAQGKRLAKAIGTDPSTVNLSGLHPVTARKFAKAAERMATAIPRALGLAKKIATIEPGFEPDDLRGAYAWANIDEGAVDISLLNCADRASLKRSLVDGVTSNQHPKGCAKEGYILIHELTHLIDSYLARTGRFGEVDFASEAVQSQIMTSCGLSGTDVANALCDYAKKSSTEWLAEAIAEALCNPKPRPVAKAALAWVQSSMR